MFFKKVDIPNTGSYWFQLLFRMDGLNRRVKEPGWNYEDKQKVYQLKDTVIKRLLTERPEEVQLRLYYVPYYKRSEAAKDQAGRLMRSSAEQQPFAYFLSQVPPGPRDMEIPEKATVEVVATCGGISFSFHMPVETVGQWGIDVAALDRKAWVSSTVFHHDMLCQLEREISGLLAKLR